MLQSQNQQAKKVVSHSPGLVDFAIGFCFLLAQWASDFLGEIQITEY